MSTTEVDAGNAHPEELDQYFKETLRTALLCMEQMQYEEALERLSTNERVLEEAKAQHFEADLHFVLATLHNIACCHQSLSRVEDSASYLEACLYNLQTAKRPKEVTRRGNETYKTKKYECRARIQLCALLSQLGRHEAALSHAQVGLRLAQSLVEDVLAFCKAHIARHRKCLPAAQSKPFSDTARKLDSAVYKQRQALVTAAFPLLELIDLRMRSKQKPLKSAAARLETRSALGVQHYSDWIYTFSMSDLMKIQPLTLCELKSRLETYAELNRDMLLDKVCLLVAGFFCVSTELRLLYGAEDSERLGEAQSLHTKAAQVAKDVFPLESPLLEHIRVSLQKYYPQRSGRLWKLETSQRLKSLSPLLKPRSSSAKSTRIRPQKAQIGRPQKKQLQLTERTSSRKVIVESKPELEENSEEEFLLCSEDLYGERHLGKRFVECSVDIRDLDDSENNEYNRVLSSTGGH